MHKYDMLPIPASSRAFWRRRLRKTKKSVLPGHAIPVQPIDVLAPAALRKLGVDVGQSRLMQVYTAGRSTQVPAGLVLNTGNRRIARKLGFGNRRVQYEWGSGFRRCLAPKAPRPSRRVVTARLSVIGVRTNAGPGTVRFLVSPELAQVLFVRVTMRPPAGLHTVVG